MGQARINLNHNHIFSLKKSNTKINVWMVGSSSARRRSSSNALKLPSASKNGPAATIKLISCFIIVSLGNGANGG